MKRFFSMFLATLMALSCMPLGAIPAFATDSGTDTLSTTFSKYLVATNALTDDGTLGIPVTLKTYVKDASNHLSEAIMYIINHAEARIGQESDESILADYIDEGYIVITVDYHNNALANAGNIEYSLQNLRKKVQSGNYIGSLKFANSHKAKQIMILPAGYRIARNVKYFDLLTQGAKGTAEYVVDTWNSEVFQTKYGSKIPACEGNNNEGGWYAASTVEEMVRPNLMDSTEALPLDFNLYLDIIYPSQPTKETPVFLNASSHETREGISTVSYAGLVQTGLTFRGYTTVVYDHEYNPLSRNDHYGYFSPGFSLYNLNGVKTHTAAVRCVRYYADTYGYSTEGYSVCGGSKASPVSLLGQPNPETRAEASTWSGEYDDKYGNEDQPFLTYADSTEKIDGQVQVVYTLMGPGTRMHASLVTEETSPTIIACGELEEYWDWEMWPEVQATYLKYDVPHLAMSMHDLGHTTPHGIDPDLNYDRTQAAIDFIDYWTGGAAPELIYSYPVDGYEKYDGEDPIQLQFTGQFSIDEISSKVKILDADGNEVKGGWTAKAGNMLFEFTAYEQYENKSTYSIVISNTLTSLDGRAIDKATTRTFTVLCNERVLPTKDAYIEINSDVNAGNAATVELAAAAKKGYLEFDISAVKEKALSTALVVNVENDAYNAVAVYALSADAPAWEESSILWSSAPANVEGIALDTAYAEKIAVVGVSGSGQYKVDISEYVAALEGNTVRLVLVGEYTQSEAALALDFESLNKQIDTNNACATAYSDTYFVRFGNNPNKTGSVISSDFDHTTGTGKSFKLALIDGSQGRAKFHNTFNSSALTAEDVGKAYTLSFWAYSEEDVSVKAGVMACSSGSYYTSFYGDTTTVDVKAGEWTKISFNYVLDQTNIDEQIAMLSVQVSGPPALYIDDIAVELMATDVTLTSKEGHNAAEGKFAPYLSVDTNVKYYVAEVDGVKYESFDEAWAAVPTNGTETTVTLLDDYTFESQWQVESGKNVIFDLGEKTLTLGGSNAYGATVAGKITFRNGTLSDPVTSEEGRTDYSFQVKGNSTTCLTLGSDLTVNSQAGYGFATVGGSVSSGQNGNFVMQEGVVVNTRRLLVYCYSGGAMTVHGGTVTSNAGLMFAVKQTSGYSAPRYIYGGTFTVKNEFDSQYVLINSSAGLSVSGGTFSETFDSAFLAEGYALKSNADGTYSVVNEDSIVYAAKIGSTKYTTFAEALAAVPTDGTETTVQLLDNVTLTSQWQIASGTNLILDLGGKTLTVSGTDNQYGVLVKGILKLKNGTVEDTNGSNRTYTFRVNGGSNSLLEFVSALSVTSKAKNGIVTVGNGMSDTSLMGTFVMNDGVTVKTLFNLAYCCPGGKLVINGGDVENTATDILFALKNNGTYYETREINGGTFKVNATTDTYKLFNATVGLVVKGGTYNEEIQSEAIADGYKLKDNGDGTYTVVSTAVAKIGDTSYESFSDAMDAVPTDGTATTVTLLQDVTVEATWTVASGKNLTLDLGGKTLTLTGTQKFLVTVNGILRLKNGTVNDSACTGMYTFNVQGASALLEFCDGLTVNSYLTFGSWGTGGAVNVGNSNTTATFVMYDGAKVYTNWNLFYAYENSFVKIYGGYVENTVNGSLFYPIPGNEKIIYGGIFKSVTDGASRKMFRGNGGLTLAGGTYTENPLRSGGTIPAILDGCATVANTDGTWSVLTGTQVTLGTGVNILETSVKLDTADTYETQTDIFLVGSRDIALLSMDNRNGKLFFEKNGAKYYLCDAKGNDYVIGSNAVTVAAIYDNTKGTVRYAVGNKLAYYKSGNDVLNTYGTACATKSGTVVVGSYSEATLCATVSALNISLVTADAPRIVGTQMSTVNNAVRVLSGIDSLYYSAIGFRAVRGDGTTKEWMTSVVFTSVEALGKTETAESLGCEYLSGFIVNGLDEATNGDTFTVTPIVYVGEQAIEGETVTFTIAVDGGVITVVAETN